MGVLIGVYLGTLLGFNMKASSDATEGASIGTAAAARRLGAIGGKRGGVARAKTLSLERRREIAQGAAKARWGARKA